MRGLPRRRSPGLSASVPRPDRREPAALGCSHRIHHSQRQGTNVFVPKLAGRAVAGGNRISPHRAGVGLLGAPANYPALVGVRGRLSDQQIAVIVRNGKGRMPATPEITNKEIAALLHFLGASPMDVTSVPKPTSTQKSDKVEAQSLARNTGQELKYRFTG